MLDFFERAGHILVNFASWIAYLEWWQFCGVVIIVLIMLFHLLPLMDFDI